MKIAILHEMLVKFGGAEQVVQQFLNIFPQADIFTLMYDKEKMSAFFPKNTIHPQVFDLPTQKLYHCLKKQRFCLPLMARSIEKLDFSGYDVVLCSSSGFAHGAITKPETKFIVYYHAPARYLWDWTNEYKKDIGFDKGFKGLLLNKLFLKLRQWDIVASNRPDVSIANSANTARRIKKYYRKEAQVIYPGVDTKRFAKKLSSSPKAKQHYYIIISALSEFKKIEVAIEGFNKMPEQNLVIVGQGTYEAELKRRVKGKNISFVGPKYGDELVLMVQNSLGLIFPGEEDFGIVVIEIMAAGKPVFAYKGGGLMETLEEGVTGEFFEDKEGKDFVEKFQKFDSKNKSKKYKALDCKKQAERFGIKIFEKAIKNIIFDNHI